MKAAPAWMVLVIAGPRSGPSPARSYHRGCTTPTCSRPPCSAGSQREWLPTAQGRARGQDRLVPGEALPAGADHVDVGGGELDERRPAAGVMRGDQRRPGPSERVEDQPVERCRVGDAMADERDWLHRRVLLGRGRASE